jgi:hypothetical protein
VQCLATRATPECATLLDELAAAARLRR